MLVSESTKAKLKQFALDFNRLYAELPDEHKSDYINLNNIFTIMFVQSPGRMAPLINYINNSSMLNFIARIVAKLGTDNVYMALPKSRLPEQIRSIKARFDAKQNSVIENEIGLLILNFLNDNKDNGVFGDLFAICHKFWPNLDQLIHGVFLPTLLANINFDDINQDLDNLSTFINPKYKKTVKQLILFFEYNKLKHELANLADTAQEPAIKARMSNIVSIIKSKEIKRIAELNEEIKLIETNPNKKDKLSQLQEERATLINKSLNLDLHDMLYLPNGVVNPEIIASIKIIISLVYPKAKAVLTQSQNSQIKSLVDMISNEPNKFAEQNIDSVIKPEEECEVLRESRNTLIKIQRKIQEKLKTTNSENFLLASEAELEAKKAEQAIKQEEHNKGLKTANVEKQILKQRSESKEQIADVNSMAKKLDPTKLNYIIKQRLNTKNNKTLNTKAKRHADLLISEYSQIVYNINLIKSAKALPAVQVKQLCLQTLEQISGLHQFLISGGSVATSESQQRVVEQNLILIRQTPDHFAGANEQDKLKDCFRLFIETKMFYDRGDKIKGGDKLEDLVKDKDFELISSLKQQELSLQALTSAIDAAHQKIQANNEIIESLIQQKQDIITEHENNLSRLRAELQSAVKKHKAEERAANKAFIQSLDSSFSDDLKKAKKLIICLDQKRPLSDLEKISLPHDNQDNNKPKSPKEFFLFTLKSFLFILKLPIKVAYVVLVDIPRRIISFIKNRRKHSNEIKHDIIISAIDKKLEEMALRNSSPTSSEPTNTQSASSNLVKIPILPNWYGEQQQRQSLQPLSTPKLGYK